MNNREMAKAYSSALEINAVQFSDVIEWADSIIRDEDDPDIEVIEVAASKKPSEAVTHLNQYAIGADSKLSNQLLFGIFHSALTEKLVSHSTVARKLYFMAMGDSELGKFGELFGFWDSIDLAEDGVYGDLEVEHGKLREFLENERA